MKRMQKHASKEYDWSTLLEPKKQENTGCKFILPKKLIKLAVLRNRIKRVIRNLPNNQKYCYFKIKTAVTKKNCEQIIEQIRLSLSHS